jgi:hypothetical protein
MTIFIDLAGSWIIRVSMIAVMLGLSVNMNDALYKTTLRANTRSYLATLDTVMYSDLSRANYCKGYSTVVGTKYWIVLNNVGQWVTPDAAFWTADSNDCEIFADINNDGTPEVVEYWAQKVPGSNPVRYKMTRTENNWTLPNAPVIGTDFTRVKFTYYDSTGTQTTTRSRIKSVRIQLAVLIPGDSIKLKPADPTDTTYVKATSIVDFRIFPANL